MIDILLIMLVFFMVTSTYLNLDIIPMAESKENTTNTSTPANSQTVTIRLDEDGRAYLQGQPILITQIATTLRDRGEELNILILPSARASTQSLVTLMDTLTISGLNRMRIVQLKASQ